MTPRKITIIPIPQAGFAEPTLEEILADPITQAVMAADAVDAGELVSCFTTLLKQRTPALTKTPFAPAEAGAQDFANRDLAKRWVPASAGTNG
jgi:hypothetical protein